MKTIHLIILCILIAQAGHSQSVGIGTTTPHASAALDVSSVTQGMLVPRMSSSQRTMISSPAPGLLVFDLTTNSFWFRNSSTWVELVDSVSNEVHRNSANTIYMGMTDSVGIGIANPTSKLDINKGSARTGTHATNLPLYVTGQTGDASNGFEIRHSNGTQGLGLGQNTLYAAGSNASQDLKIKAKGAAGILSFTTNNIERVRIGTDGIVSMGNYSIPSNSYLQLKTPGGNAYKSGIQLRNFGDNVGWTLESDDIQNHFLIKRHPGDLNGIVALSIYQGTGNIGIGTTYANAPLQLANTEANRKMVLKEDANNDHQFYGFGVNASAMRYQTPSTTANHVFYSGINNSSSRELFRIGSGFASMGTYTTASNNYLHVNTEGGGVFKAGIKFRNGLDFHGWTLESDDILGRFSIKRHYFDFNGTDALIIDLYDGNVGIGGAEDTNKLKVHGSVAVTGSVKIGYTTVSQTQNNIPPGVTHTLVCTCPAGTVVIGGGYSQTIGTEIIANYPSSETSWVVQGKNHTPNPASLYATAICARIGN